MIKAIIMDMDGTLLDSNDHIMPKTKEALIELEKQGVTIILASGRCYTRLMPYAKELELDKHHGYLLEVDGISVYDVQNDYRNVLVQMKPSEFKDVFEYLMNKECEVMAGYDTAMLTYFPESIYKIKEQLRKERNLPEDYPWTGGPFDWLADMREGYPDSKVIHSFDELTKDANKLQFLQEEGKIEKIYEDVSSKFGDTYEFFRTTPRQVEILPKGYSKGATLKRIMEKHGWTADEIVAFGDGENDVSMFGVAKYGFAMGQAKEYVKEKAYDVTLSNNEEGIYHALHKLELV